MNDGSIYTAYHMLLNLQSPACDTLTASPELQFSTRVAQGTTSKSQDQHSPALSWLHSKPSSLLSPVVYRCLSLECLDMPSERLEHVDATDFER